MATGLPTRRRILTLAWPVILANTAVPLLGLTDTAVLGNVAALTFSTAECEQPRGLMARALSRRAWLAARPPSSHDR